MRRARLILTLVSLVAARCAMAPGGDVIEQYESTLSVQADGSLLGQDRFVVHLGASPVTEFRWQVPTWRHDGVSVIAASMDGASARYDTGRGRDFDVRWRFPPATGSHVFGLSYRALNVIHLSGSRAQVSWRAIPAGRRPDVRSTHIRLAVPDFAVLLDDPWVDEAGWTVTREPHGLTASRASVPAGESATVGIDFSADRLTASIPDWQTHGELAEEFVPAFISAAIFILIVAAGAIWMVWLRYPPWRVPAAAGTAAAVPDLPALDLPVPLQRALLRDRTGGGRASRADRSALLAAGLVDPDRAIVLRDLRRAGIAIVLFGALSWIVVQWALWQYGAWRLVVPWSIVMAGVMLIMAAARFPVWTETGATARVLYCARFSDGRTPE
jgi:hypothetical protein